MTVGSVGTTNDGLDPVKTDLARLRRSIGQVFGSVFFGTLLRAMRTGELKGPYGHGGFGEEVFGAQLDGILAERSGTSMANSLLDALYTSLARQQERISGLRANA